MQLPDPWPESPSQAFYDLFVSAEGRQNAVQQNEEQHDCNDDPHCDWGSGTNSEGLPKEERFLCH